MNATQYGLPAPTLPSRRPSLADLPDLAVVERVPTMPRLTAKRKAILEFMRRYQDEHSMPPSMREIGRAVELASSSTIHCHLQALVRLGELEYARGVPRSYRLPNTRRRTVADLEAEILRLEAELDSRFQAGYQAGWRACSEQSCVETSPDAQGYPQAASQD